jgi:hypothetical protein
MTGWRRRMPGRRTWLTLVGAAIAVALAISLLGSRSAPLDPLAACARALSAGAAEGARAGAEDPDQEGGDAGACAIRNHPETFADLQTATNALGQRVAAPPLYPRTACLNWRARLAESWRASAGS